MSSNIKYTAYVRGTGEILYSGEAQHPQFLETEAVCIHIGDRFGPGWIDLSGYTPLPSRPSEHHTFNYAIKQWEDPRTLEDLKAAKNAAIDLARERADSTTFMFQGLSIAVDPLSKGDIMGAHGEWLTGQAPEGWPGGWKSKDKGPNGESLYVPIPDQATWLAFYRAMVAQGTANFAHAQALKAQLAAATTAEEVAAVPDWRRRGDSRKMCDPWTTNRHGNCSPLKP